MCVCVCVCVRACMRARACACVMITLTNMPTCRSSDKVVKLYSLVMLSRTRKHVQMQFNMIISVSYGTGYEGTTKCLCLTLTTQWFRTHHHTVVSHSLPYSGFTLTTIWWFRTLCTHLGMTLMEGVTDTPSASRMAAVWNPSVNWKECQQRRKETGTYVCTHCTGICTYIYTVPTDRAWRLVKSCNPQYILGVCRYSTCI